MTAVYTHFSGSVCVVELTPGALRPGSNGTYIDAQRRGSLDYIELVRGGQVKQRFFEYPKDAPERIIVLIKENQPRTSITKKSPSPPITVSKNSPGSKHSFAPCPTISVALCRASTPSSSCPTTCEDSTKKRRSISLPTS